MFREPTHCTQETLDARISQIGAVAKAALDKGDPIPDDVVVNLIVLNIAILQLSMSRPSSSNDQEADKPSRKGKKGSANSSKTPKQEEPEINASVWHMMPNVDFPSITLSSSFSFLFFSLFFFFF